MFKEISYITYEPDKKANMYLLHDTCFSASITSPFNSPSIRDQNHRLTNALTVLSLIRHYESINRNVGRNLRLYFYWLYCQGYSINANFIKTMLNGLDLMPGTNTMVKYYRNIVYYFDYAKNHRYDI
jgi:hypothetical protein